MNLASISNCAAFDSAMWCETDLFMNEVVSVDVDCEEDEGSLSWLSARRSLVTATVPVVIAVDFLCTGLSEIFSSDCEAVSRWIEYSARFLWLQRLGFSLLHCWNLVEPADGLKEGRNPAAKSGQKYHYLFPAQRRHVSSNPDLK